MTILVLGAWVFLATAALAESNVWRGNGPYGGSICALVVDPSNPEIVYAAAERCGVFKSTNGGASWKAANTGLDTALVHALVIDPSNPKTLYAGCSSGGCGPDYGYYVYKSTDGGGSWKGMMTGFRRVEVFSLAIAPSNSSTLYAGTLGNGVFRSTDGGATWKRTNTGLEGAWSSKAALVVDPMNSKVAYVGTHGHGIFKSVNGGETWTESNGGMILGYFYYVNALAIDPAKPTTVYAGTAGGVFKSTDGGRDWNAVNTGIGSLWVNAVAVAGSSPRTVYAGTSGYGIFMTTNGGASWEAQNAGLRDNSIVRAVAIDPAQSSTAYAGTALWLPGGEVYQRTDPGGGIYKRTDSLGTWKPMNKGLTGEVIVCLAVDPSSPTSIYAGARFADHLYFEGGGVFKSTNGGGTWKSMNSGLWDGSIWALAIDPSRPNTIWAVAGCKLYRSTNGGESWSWIQGADRELTNYSITFVAVDPSTPTTVYLGVQAQGVLKSTDAGGSWKLASSGMRLFGGDHVDVIVIDPSHPATVYAGTCWGARGYGCLFKSTDGGDRWTDISKGTGWDEGVYTVAIDPLRPRTLFAGPAGYGAFKSTDGGGTWHAINTGLPDSPHETNICGFAFDPSNPKVLYAAVSANITYVDYCLTGCRVFRSTNGGGVWEAMSPELGNWGLINAIAIVPSSPTTLYAATQAGGVRMIALPALEGNED